MDLSGVCPKQLGAFMCHDNAELRRAIYEFLKVCWVNKTEGCVHVSMHIAFVPAPRACVASMTPTQPACSSRCFRRGPFAAPPANAHVRARTALSPRTAPQDPLYRPDLYLSMMEFRELTLVSTHGWPDTRLGLCFSWQGAMGASLRLASTCSIASAVQRPTCRGRRRVLP